MSSAENSLELISFDGEIMVVDSLKDLELSLNELRKEELLGFDTETKPSFKKGEKYSISLLQLSGAKKAYLFRLNKIGFPNGVKQILEDENILKVGLAIRDDLKGLKELNEFIPKSFVEIQEVAKTKGLKSQGLQTITEELFQKRLSKKAKLTNWEASKLTESQILYAATDAWIGREIYLALQN
ncbi:MAG: 3'-5' exonuclease domain-containing protein 2 [Bacteriovoracaceae bacterium]|jgi:ribonuclease D|nr:3'-5' exonuclease domain-containing protein 2 [Bacteriovoracaceae bacterium]